MVKYAFLLTSYLLLFINQSSGQCDIPFAPVDVYEPDIPIYCDGLDGFCSQLPPEYTLFPMWGCPPNEFFVHNAHVLGFVAGSTELTLEIVPSNCTFSPTGTGIHGVLFEELFPGEEYAVPIAMNCGTGFEEPMQIMAEGMLIGKVYYLVIDGWSGNVCDYEINVLQGSTEAGQFLEPPTIFGPTEFCFDSLLVFSVEAVDACIFEWEVTGGEFTEFTNSVIEVAVTDPDNVMICVESTNLCVNSEQVCLTLDQGLLMESDSMLMDTICVGEIYTLGGESFSESGQYEVSDTMDCEITHFDLNLTVLPSQDTTFIEEICSGNCLIFDGMEYCEPGTYEIIYSSVNGCDSTIILVIDQSSLVSSQTEDTFCPGNSYEWNNQTYTEPGTYEVELVTAERCDSLAMLELSYGSTNLYFSPVICSNESYIFDGVEYSEDVYVENMYTDSEGCDSIRILDLTVNPVFIADYQFTICETDTLIFAGGQYTQAGNYQIIKENLNACDSIFFMSLEVLDTSIVEQTIAIESGEMYQGIVIYGDTTFVELGENVLGCDSTTITNLEVYVGIEEANSLGIEVFPNPFTDRFNIKNKSQLEIIEMHLFSVDGKKIIVENNCKDNSDCLVSLTTLDVGSYFLVIQTQNKIFTKKLIKL